MECPNCHSQAVVKNGSTHTGKQKYLCKDCGHQFVENPQNRNRPIPQWKRDIIDRLLLERLSLGGIARAVEVSESGLQNYVNQKYNDIPREVTVTKKPRRRLTIECDEMWSFVQNKQQKDWITI